MLDLPFRMDGLSLLSVHMSVPYRGYVALVRDIVPYHVVRNNLSYIRDVGDIMQRVADDHAEVLRRIS